MQRLPKNWVDVDTGVPIRPMQCQEEAAKVLWGTGEVEFRSPPTTAATEEDGLFAGCRPLDLKFFKAATNQGVRRATLSFFIWVIRGPWTTARTGVVEV